MVDPDLWDKLDDLEHALAEVRLYCFGFFFIMVLAAAASLVFYCGMADIKADLRETRQGLANIKTELYIIEKLK